MLATKTKNSFITSPFSLYAFSWVLYRLQDVWYRAGGIVSLAILLALILVSLVHTLRLFLSRDYRPPYLRGLIAMLILFTIYGILLIVTDGLYSQGLSFRPPTYYYLKTYYISLFPIISCYYFTKKGYLDTETLQKWSILFILFGIVEYLHWQNSIALQMRELGLDEENVNNVGYVMVSIIPCLYIINKRWLQYLGMTVCFSFVLFSMKRGAILCGVIVVASLFVLTLKQTRGAKKALSIILVSLLLLLLYFLLENTLFQSDFFQRRLESTLEGNMSGRDSLIKRMLSFYANDATVLEQLFGIGADGTLKISSNYAHNDWVELLINQGALGIIVYLYYWICFIKTAKRKRLSSSSRNVLWIILIYTFIQSFFSMSISGFNIYIATILGFALADGFSKKQFSTES